MKLNPTNVLISSPIRLMLCLLVTVQVIFSTGLTAFGQETKRVDLEIELLDADEAETTQVSPSYVSGGDGEENLELRSAMTIDLLDRVAISSSVEGVIKNVTARSGDQVRQGQLLIQLDTGRLVTELGVAKSEYNALSIRSADHSRVQIGNAREQTARLSVQKLQEVRTRYNIKVAALEMNRAQSELKQAESEKTGACNELEQFRCEAEAKQNQIKLLENDLKQSTILSQYSGAIGNIEKRPGEFVNKGDIIAELYRLDRLSGVILIDNDQLPPENAKGVKGQFEVGKGNQKRSFEISISRVFPRVDIDGKYRAYVELENEQADGNWRLLPGMVGLNKQSRAPLAYCTGVAKTSEPCENAPEFGRRKNPSMIVLPP